MDELNKVLEKSEKVLWQGAPAFKPFFFGGGGSIIAAIVGFVFIGASLFVGAGTIFFLLVPHFWIGLFLVFGVPLYNFLVYKKIYYAITDKRVLMQGGLVGRDFEMVDFDQITNTEVNVGVADKLFGSGNTGTILISTAGTFTYSRSGQIAKPYRFSNITNPYDVFKFFKKVSHDVKTDINYPNKYRPKTNPGYPTDYKPKKK